MRRLIRLSPYLVAVLLSLASWQCFPLESILIDEAPPRTDTVIVVDTIITPPDTVIVVDTVFCRKSGCSH